MIPNASRCLRHHIYLSSNFWDGLWIIQQPICNEIQREEPVLYVERFVSLFTMLRHPRWWRRLFTWLRGARSLTPNLRVLAPLPLFHMGHRFPRLFQLEFVIQRRWILWWVKRQAPGARVLWIDNPLYRCALGAMGETASTYHVGDEIAAFPTSDRSTMQSLERHVLANVDLVFAAAEKLAEDKRQWHKRVATVWNAIDPHAFQHTPPQGALDDVLAIPSPRVAFVGVLDAWVDFDVLALAASRLEHVHFLIVGPSHAVDSTLRTRANVHFLGRRDRLLVPSILRQCSASLVPFRRTELTERLVPLKVFEALAAGIQPVCTAFSPDLTRLAREGFAVVAKDPNAFIAGVESAIRNDTPQRRTQLAAFGQRQTWAARWNDMRTTLNEYMTLAKDQS